MPTKTKTPLAATKKAVPAKKAATKTSAKKSLAKPAGKTVPAKKATGTLKKTATTKKSAAKKSAKPVAKKTISKKPVAEARPGHGIDLVRRCVKALDDKKAASIEVIYVGENSSITDYFIIATGTSDPHLRALRIELEKAIDVVVPAGTVRVQNEPNSGWCVVDAFDVVIHVLSAEKRASYNLEKLYSAGEKISIKDFI